VALPFPRACLWPPLESRRPRISARADHGHRHSSTARKTYAECRAFYGSDAM
jgi:hypothetical protein